MLNKPINGRDPDLSEEDLQREELGPRGVLGKESPDEDNAAAGKEDSMSIPVISLRAKMAACLRDYSETDGVGRLRAARLLNGTGSSQHAGNSSTGTASGGEVC